MTIPDFQTIMLPLLEYARDGKPHSATEATEYLVKRFGLTRQERNELLPSGKQEIINNRSGWAQTHLKKAGLLKSTERGYFCITERGLETLKQNLDRIDRKYLIKFEEYRAFRFLHKRKTTDERKEADFPETQTPKEQIEYAYQQITEDLEIEILENLKAVTSKKFEHIVIDLLVGMGYGGNRKDAAMAIGRSGDEGLDGVINEDKLGISKIYVQAKKWSDNSVRHKDIRNFIGSLDVAHADKGLFITTSDFNKDAKEAAEKSSKKIIVINGVRLAKLMIEHRIGVSIEDIFEIKRLDTDYFTD